MTPLAIKEIQAIPDFLDTYRILLCAVPQDELFEKQKRAFVRDLLADLNKRLPRVLRGEFGAVRTLSVLNKVLDLKDLFEDGGGEHLCA